MAIRQWLLEEDLIDVIVALPNSMFYGTGIGTYVWILDRNKDPERKGKIQLIDGSGQWKSMRKPMGEKRREMSKNNRDVVLEAYKAFEHAEPTISRVMRSEEHTSELQSLMRISYAVFCLKKKTNIHLTTTQQPTR